MVPNARWSIIAGANREDAGGDFAYTAPAFRGGGEQRRLNARSRRFGGHVNGAWDGESASVRLRVHGSQIDRGSPGSIAQPSGTATQDHARWGASASAEAGGAHLGVSALLGTQSQEARHVDASPPVGPAYDQETRVNQIEWASQSWWMTDPVALRVGVEGRRKTLRGNALADDATRRIVETGLWGRLERTDVVGDFQTRLSLGARLDRHDLVEGSTVSPSLTASIQAPRTTLRLSVRNGFSPPGVSDLFFQEGVLVRPNPDLEPERVRNEIEATLRRSLELGRLSLTGGVSAYRAEPVAVCSGRYAVWPESTGPR